MNDIIEQTLKESQLVLNQFISDKNNLKQIKKAAATLINSINKGNKIISCGNGGSMCDAMHFAEELTGKFRNHRKAIAAIAISDPSHITCVANDYGFEYVYSRYIEAVGKKGDVLLAISTSGNSKNVINAVKQAKKQELKTIALTGKNGGDISKICDIEIRAPYSDYADRAQEIHIKIIHILIQLIETSL